MQNLWDKTLLSQYFPRITPLLTKFDIFQSLSSVLLDKKSIFASISFENVSSVPFLSSLCFEACFQIEPSESLLPYQALSHASSKRTE